MQIKLLVSVAAIALVATIGSASADEQFSTLAGLSPEPLPPAEMAAIKAGSELVLRTPSNKHFILTDVAFNSRLHVPFHRAMDAGAPVFFAFEG